MNDEDKQAIRDELESLKAQGTRRRELSLHACKRLFFDHAVRPTLANVRDLTGVGSASDIPKDIEFFWERVRDTSKVRIDTGVLPPALHRTAGELLHSLYDAALATARDELAQERVGMQQTIAAAEQKVRDAQLLYEHARAELQRHHAAWTEAALKEGEAAERLATERAMARRAHEQVAVLEGRLADSEAEISTLRNKVESLQTELKACTEHYAAEIKDAIANAERRVKPLLVELDALRSAASSYQTGLREQSRKEFEHIQQLAAIKARADTLQNQLDTKSDEVDRLSRQIEQFRVQAGVPSALGKLVADLALAGRLTHEEIASIGTAVDGYVALPSTCAVCGDAELELYEHDGRFELQCPACERTSGEAPSRLSAYNRFAAAVSPWLSG
ncbi:DNA-binding protein [Mycetohabitans sp. B46]|uniref:DNA-binding protein n=1 Tax=Mycetohabitans sp. B46 TaxID=2772536 RepID=UPI00307D098C